jgi:hypothetical protein
MRKWSCVQVGLVSVLAALTLGATPASGDTGPPVSTVSPIAQGSPGAGNQLVTDSGSWSTDATFTYAWMRCGSHLEDCTAIPGAAEETYVVAVADAGHVLVVRVTATNAAGSADALSNALGPVTGRPPAPRHKPSIKGTKKAGQHVYETADKWTHSPDTFAIRWLRCSAAGKACVPIAGKRTRCASGSCMRVDVGTQWDYDLTAKDVGHRLRVRVDAWNGAGQATAASKVTRIVTR